MTECKTCNYRFKFENNIPEDGLCTMCHMGTCKKDANDCERCVDAITKLIKWVRSENALEEQKNEEI